MRIQRSGEVDRVSFQDGVLIVESAGQVYKTRAFMKRFEITQDTMDAQDPGGYRSFRMVNDVTFDLSFHINAFDMGVTESTDSSILEDLLKIKEKLKERSDQ